MCSQSEDFLDKNLSKLKTKINLDKCKKCENKSFVLLQKKDVYCRSCLYDYCSHKFRSTIGKSKLVRHGERILVAFSGGISSSAMMDMIVEGLNVDQHRKLIFSPSIIHVDEGITLNHSLEERKSLSQTIGQLMLASGWTSYLTSLEMFLRDDKNASFFHKLESSENIQVMTSEDASERFNKLFGEINSLTSKEEFIKCLRTRLIVEIAKKEKFNRIFFANNASGLSIDLITETAQGKGSQIKWETGVSDERYEVPILKPMREFVIKELVFYNIMKGVNWLSNESLTSRLQIKSSIRKLTESFVVGLQENFPATVYTILRTGNKLMPPENYENKCIFCQSPIEVVINSQNCAYNALKLTKSLSKNLSEEHFNEPKSTCYGCNLILTGHDFESAFLKRTTEQDIERYLIDNDD